MGAEGKWGKERNRDNKEVQKMLNKVPCLEHDAKDRDNVVLTRTEIKPRWNTRWDNTVSGKQTGDFAARNDQVIWTDVPKK